MFDLHVFTIAWVCPRPPTFSSFSIYCVASLVKRYLPGLPSYVPQHSLWNPTMQWFSTRRCFALRRCLAMFGSIGGFHNLGHAAGILWAEAREAAKYPVIHRTPPPHTHKHRTPPPYTYTQDPPTTYIHTGLPRHIHTHTGLPCHIHTHTGLPRHTRTHTGLLRTHTAKSYPTQKCPLCQGWETLHKVSCHIDC